MKVSIGGLGIGLNSAKRLIEMHGGQIVAKSKGLGQGSEFLVRLPVALAVVRKEAPDAIGGQPGYPARRRILVVDYNRDSATSLGLLLKTMGNEVSVAHDGQEAIEMAASFRPEVIIMDIGMPNVNGYEAAIRIRQQPWGNGMVLIALSGWGREEDQRRSKAAGFDHHLIKPVEPLVLKQTLQPLEASTG